MKVRCAGNVLFAVFAFATFMITQRAQAGDCHPALDAMKPQYVLGYGSLLDARDKARSAPMTSADQPLMLSGYTRGWIALGEDHVGFNATLLGVQIDPDGKVAGALYRDYLVSDIASTDKREASYCRGQVDPAQITMLDGSTAPTDGPIWIYLPQPAAIAPPSAELPIIQSYVDLFINGCLEIAVRVVDPGIDFAELCVTTTQGWSQHWVNDRIYPRRPQVFEPNATIIDALLARLVPEAFAAITIE